MTAVVAGTAGAVQHHQQQKYASAEAQQQAEAQSAYEQGMAAGQAQQTEIAAAPAAAPASTGIDMDQLKQLADLHSAGVLSDEEFAAAKAKLLGTM